MNDNRALDEVADGFETVVDRKMLRNAGIQEQTAVPATVDKLVAMGVREILREFLHVSKDNDPNTNLANLVKDLKRMARLTDNLADLVNKNGTEPSQNFISNLFDEFAKGHTIPGVR